MDKVPPEVHQVYGNTKIDPFFNPCGRWLWNQVYQLQTFPRTHYNLIQAQQSVSLGWIGKLYSGTTLSWEYDKRNLHIYILWYILQALT